MLLFTFNTPVGHAPFCKHVKLTRGTTTQLFIEQRPMYDVGRPPSALLKVVDLGLRPQSRSVNNLDDLACPAVTLARWSVISRLMVPRVSLTDTYIVVESQFMYE